MTEPNPSFRRDILVFAALGVASGLISWLAGNVLSPDWLRFSFIPFGWHSSAAPVVPGLVFGVLVAACCRHYGTKDWWALIGAVLVTTRRGSTRSISPCSPTAGSVTCARSPTSSTRSAADRAAMAAAGKAEKTASCSAQR
jgi:predicted membrane protein